MDFLTAYFIVIMNNPIFLLSTKSACPSRRFAEVPFEQFFDFFVSR